MKSARATVRNALKPTVIRVGIYTRQSVEDTRSPFTSIHAQREAVEAYVRSQAELGWRAIPTRYDDGGYSGTTLNRPAFKRLIADAEAGLIDLVAFYKYDRIGRTQMNQLATLERLRELGVPFVSTTQTFDTDSIMGRGMIGMQAVFSEMERAQIAERTRDKIHAMRRRGMWTGGPLPLGYDLDRRKLVVNPEEAERVREIYKLFLARGSLTETLAVLRERDWRTKTWRTNEDKTVLSRPFDKDTLRRFLLDPVPRGRVRLDDETFPGLHERIVDEDLASAVEAALMNPRAAQITSGNKRGVVLRGMVVCGVCGTTMRVGCGGKGRPYFVCGRVVEEGARACPGSRVSVPVLEQGVIDRVRSIGRDPAVVEATLAAVCAERESQIAAATARVRALDGERARTERERGRLIDAIAQGGSASLTERIAAMDAEVATLKGRSADADAEIGRLRSTTIDQDELRALLADFDPIWCALFQTERERILRLLIHAIRFDGRTGTVTIEFNGEGDA